MEIKHVHDIYEELTKINKNSASDRARGAAMVMEHYGDKEMADTLRLLSGQLDFDDSMGANDAIKRTNEKLDKLIAEREKHHAFSYIISLTDDMVLNMSGGEVIDSSYSSVKSSFLKHGLFDPDIFGGSGRIPYFDDEKSRFNLSEYGTGMGHIQLPCHVVLESSYKLIAFLLGKSEEDIEKLARYTSVVVTDSGNTDLEVGTILTENEYRKYVDSHKNVSVNTGGDAIYDMLKALGYSDQPERLAFSVVPVVSPVTRPIAYCRKDDMYYCDPLNRKYEEVIRLSNRLAHLKGLGAPDVIINNESRMLDAAVNELRSFTVDQNMKRFRKDNKHSVLSIHAFCQRAMVHRSNMLNAFIIPSEKTGEIESLGIYPETIRVRSEDGTYENISLSDIVDACDDAMWKYEQEHLVVAPDGVDSDNLPPELQAKADEAEEGYNNMQATLDSILDGAKNVREVFTVRLEESGMYVPWITK